MSDKHQRVSMSTLIIHVYKVFLNKHYWNERWAWLMEVWCSSSGVLSGVSPLKHHKGLKNYLKTCILSENWWFRVALCTKCLRKAPQFKMCFLCKHEDESWETRIYNPTQILLQSRAAFCDLKSFSLWLSDKMERGAVQTVGLWLQCLNFSFSHY